MTKKKTRTRKANGSSRGPFAQRLRAWREKLGKNQFEMADFLAMPYRTFQDIEGGQSRGTAFTRSSLTLRMNIAKIPTE